MRKILVYLFITAAVLLGLFPCSALAANDSDILRIGDQDEYVSTLQDRLGELGYFIGVPTGYFGVATQQAVIDYQKDNNLPVDGKIGSNTLASLLGDKLPKANTLNASDTAACYPGDKGEAVAALQRRLALLEYYDYDHITGYYGPVTQQAVKRFQRVNGLTVSGVAEPETVALLTSGRAVELCLYPGDRGRDVRQLQQRLAALGYLDGTPSGFFGAVTLQALKEFQAQAGYPINSRTDQSTRALIQSDDALSWDGVQRISDGASSTKTVSSVDKMLAFAVSLLSKPYAYAAEGPNSFDSDGFVCYVLRYMGVVSAGVSAATLSGMENCEKITDIQTLMRGDVLFFESGSSVNHVGISLGDGHFIHSSSSQGAVVTSSLSGYYQQNFCFARRVF